MTTRSSSRSSRPIWRISRSATSRGPRIAQRAVGQSASSRRPSSNAATSWAALAAPTPGIAASSSSLARARPVRPSCGGERVGREVDGGPAADPAPHSSAMSSAAVSPAAPRRASRSRGRSVAGSSRMAWPAAARLRLGSGHDGLRLTAGSGRPRGPDDGSPPNSPRHPDPEDDAEPSERALTGHSPRLGRGLAPGQAGATAAPGGELGEHEEDPVERGVQADRRPDRPAPEEQPAEREGDRDPRRAKPTTASPSAWPAVDARDRQDVDDREEQRAPDERPPRAQVAHPRRRGEARNRISSPIGATIAPASRFSTNPPSSPVGGSGLTGVVGRSG